MIVKYYLTVAALLFGIGIGTMLYRRNLLAIILGNMTAGGGVMVAMATIAVQKKLHAEGFMFLISFAAVQILFLIVSCAVIYRRYIIVKHTDVAEGNQLKN